MRKIRLPTDELISLYRSGRSQHELAAHFGVAANTVARRLRELGEEIRREKPVDFDRAIAMYESGMSTEAIGAEFGVAPQTIGRRLKRAGVRLRTVADWRDKIPSREIPIDEDRLRSLSSEGLSCQEIGEQLGVSAECVRERMVKLGIDRLPPKARMEKNVFWKGGRATDDDGYILVKRPDHPHANASGYVREHRLVMEEKLGRYLLPTEVVHHKDDNPSNNHPDNLELFASNADHLRETLAGKVPNWTPEGKARMGGRPRRQSPDPEDGATRPGSGSDARP